MDGGPVLGAAARSLWEGILRWAFPDECRGCGVPLGASPTLCPTCWAGIQTWGRLQDTSISAPEEPDAAMEARAATLYDGAVRGAILAMKMEGRPRLCRPLANLIANITPPLYQWDDYIALIPIPSHRVRRAERGFNQTELLAKWLSPQVGLPVRASWLKRVKATRPLSGLEGGMEARRDEVRDAFRSGPIPEEQQGSSALLVDDILTTGATTTEAARGLIAAGLGRVDVICVARSLPDDGADDGADEGADEWAEDLDDDASEEFDHADDAA